MSRQAGHTVKQNVPPPDSEKEGSELNLPSSDQNTSELQIFLSEFEKAGREELGREIRSLIPKLMDSENGELNTAGFIGWVAEVQNFDRFVNESLRGEDQLLSHLVRSSVKKAEAAEDSKRLLIRELVPFIQECLESFEASLQEDS
ncbi:MAG: hypothetical protein KDD42_01265 [Bdellovibrionales bacterium]|nr:hypothetical protein [Bdellovibrionales bacterium]